MFSQRTSFERRRYRIGLALTIIGMVVVGFGVWEYRTWVQTYDDVQSDLNSDTYPAGIVWLRNYGEMAMAAFVIGIPILMIGINQLWTVTRYNTLAEGTMIQQLLCLSQTTRAADQSHEASPKNY